MARLVVLLDSCVLFPNLLRDTLLSTAAAGLYRAHWSQEILDGVTRNLVGRGILSVEKAHSLEQIMKDYFTEALVDVSADLISKMKNHVGDRHVLAAAIEAEAEIIVTFNLKHFNPVDTYPWGVNAQHPDLFLLGLWQHDNYAMVQVLKEQSRRLRKPPLSISELLKGLSRQVPQFALTVSDFLNFDHP